MNSDQIEEGLFYFLIFLTLKIIGLIVLLSLQTVWVGVIFVYDTIRLNINNKETNND